MPYYEVVSYHRHLEEIGGRVCEMVVGPWIALRADSSAQLHFLQGCCSTNPWMWAVLGNNAKVELVYCIPFIAPSAATVIRPPGFGSSRPEDADSAFWKLSEKLAAGFKVTIPIIFFARSDS